jgi:hypothetical protein
MARLSIASNGCFWSKAALWITIVERPLLVKADAQNCEF